MRPRWSPLWVLGAVAALLLLVGTVLGVSRSGRPLVPGAVGLFLPAGALIVALGLIGLRRALRRAAARRAAEPQTPAQADAQAVARADSPMLGALLAVATGVVFAVWGALSLGAPALLRVADVPCFAVIAWFFGLTVAEPRSAARMRLQRRDGAILGAVVGVVSVAASVGGIVWAVQPALA